MFKKTPIRLAYKLLISSLLVLSITACGGTENTNTSGTENTDTSDTGNTSGQCNLTWTTYEEPRVVDYQYEELIDDCTHSRALFDTPSIESEWDMTSANFRANIIIGSELLSENIGRNRLVQLDADDNTIRFIGNDDFITDERRDRSFAMVVTEGILSKVDIKVVLDSSGLSTLTYEQWDTNTDNSQDTEKVMYCDYEEKTDNGSCWALNVEDYVLVATLEYADWLKIKEQFDRGVGVDSAFTISKIIDAIRTAL